MVEKEKQVNKGPVPEIPPVVELKNLPTKKELRERVRFVFRECSDADWNDIKGAILELGFRKQKGGTTREQTIGFIEDVFRRGETGSSGINNIILRTVDKIIKSQSAMVRVNSVYDNLSKISDVSTSTAMSVLEDTTPRARGMILKFVPITVRGERNRNLLRDKSLGMSHDELAKKYNLDAETSRTLIHILLGKLVARPLARQAILNAKKRIDAKASEAEEKEKAAQESVPDIDRSTIRKTLPELSDEDWEKIEAMIPLNTKKGEEQRDRNAARRYFREGASISQLVEELNITVNGAKSKIGLVLDNLRKNPEARKIITEHLEAEQVEKAPEGRFLKRPEPIMLDRLKSPVDFDLMMMEYRNKFYNPGEMMEAGGLKHTDRLRKALRDLPRGKDAKAEWKMRFNEEVREKGQMIPAFASLLGTQPDRILKRIIDYFEEALDAYTGATLGLEDMPRVALYYVFSYHAAIIQGISSRESETGESYRRVGQKYRKFVSEKPEGVAQSVWGEYTGIEGRYLDIIKAIDPKIGRKIRSKE